MSNARLVLAIALAACLTSDAYSYDEMNMLRWAKTATSIEGLAESHDPNGLESVINTCLSMKARSHTRRLACQLVSQHGKIDVWQHAVRQLDENDPLWASLKMTEIALRVRAERSSTPASIGMKYRDFYEELGKEGPSEEPSAVQRRDSHRRTAARELVARVKSGLISIESLPASLIDDKGLTIVRFRRDLMQVKGHASQATWLEERLKRNDPYEREAAAELLAERGEEILPRVLSLLEKNIPKTEPPPFTQETRTFSSCLQVLASVGGPQAEEQLAALSTNKSHFISTNAKFYLEFVRTKIKYPIRYTRLFLESLGQP